MKNALFIALLLSTFSISAVASNLESKIFHVKMSWDHPSNPTVRSRGELKVTSNSVILTLVRSNPNCENNTGCPMAPLVYNLPITSSISNCQGNSYTAEGADKFGNTAKISIVDKRNFECIDGEGDSTTYIQIFEEIHGRRMISEIQAKTLKPVEE